MIMQPFFLADRRGSVSVMAGICFTLLVAAAGLVVHLSQFYVVKLQEQRTADIATLAAANLSNAISNGQPTSAAIETATNLADLNGFGSATLGVNVVNGSQIQVALSRTKSVYFGSGDKQKSATIASQSTSSTSTQTPACVLSLVGEINVANGGTLNSNVCGLAAATYASANGGSVTMKGVGVGYTQTAEAPFLVGATSVTPPANQFQYSYAPSDPMAGQASIVALDSKLSNMAKNGWPYTDTIDTTVDQGNFYGGQDLNVVATTAYVPQSALIGNLTVSGSTVTFAGSGFYDALCQHATVIVGTTRIRAGSTLNFNIGCYVFQGDFILDDSSTPAFVLPGISTVRMAFMGRIVNNGTSTMTLPPGSYSIAGGLSNQAGGSIVMGDGLKVLSGLISNASGSIIFSDGPFFLNGAAISNVGGTISFRTGPYYIINSRIVNAGTLTFGGGTFHGGAAAMGTYGAFIQNKAMGAGRATLNILTTSNAFGGNTNLTFGTNSTTNFAVGSNDFYSSKMNIQGGDVNFGSPSDVVSGSSLIAMVNSSLVHTAGAINANGITIAAKASTLAFGNGQLTMVAPMATAPVQGYQNLLIYSQDLGVAFNSSSQTNNISGVIYTPNGLPSFSSGFYTYGSGGCFAVVGARVQVDQNAYLGLSPCNNFPFPSVFSSRSYLKS